MISPSKNPAYVLARQDVLSMVDESKPCTSLLDVGCSRGATAALFRASRPEISRAVGIELDQQAAQAAREASFDEVHCEDAEQVLSRLATQAERFDLILCGDVLEHLLDPWTALRHIRHLCTPHGQVIISLPNVAHYSTLVALLARKWPYASRGIHDRTHLRWFAERNLKDLYEQASFREVERKKKHRLLERPHKLNAKTEPFLANVPFVSGLTVFQFLSRLEPQ